MTQRSRTSPRSTLSFAAITTLLLMTIWAAKYVFFPDTSPTSLDGLVLVALLPGTAIAWLIAFTVFMKELRELTSAMRFYCTGVLLVSLIVTITPFLYP